MPSLRNPVGPLPASIYWRRRFVVLAALAAVVVLVAVLAFGGGGSGRQATAGSVGTPASSLTPGPTHGGSNDGTAGSSGSASPSAGATASGAPTSAPSGAPIVTGPTGSGSGGSSGTSSSGGSGSTSGGSGGTGGGSTLTPNQPGTKSLPTCVATDLDLSLTSTAQTYRPSQFPEFQLGISNTGGSACKVDLGAKSAVLTITSDTGATVWSSGDCPKDTSPQWYAVPAAGDGPLTALFGWGRTTSKPGCTPGSGGGSASAGTYVAHIGLGGVSAQPQHWFKLAPFGS